MRAGSEPAKRVGFVEPPCAERSPAAAAASSAAAAGDGGDASSSGEVENGVVLEGRATMSGEPLNGGPSPAGGLQGALPAVAQVPRAGGAALGSALSRGLFAAVDDPAAQPDDVDDGYGDDADGYPEDVDDSLDEIHERYLAVSQEERPFFLTRECKSDGWQVMCEAPRSVQVWMGMY
jgi:hypothetical protein